MTGSITQQLVATLGSCALAGVVFTGCFSGDENSALAQDCSTAKTALETARNEMSAAQSKILASPQSARSELQKIARKLNRAADGIEDAELKSAVIAAADDLEKAFGAAGAPASTVGSGLAKLDQVLQSRCTDR